MPDLTALVSGFPLNAYCACADMEQRRCKGAARSVELSLLWAHT